jgi:hypothetical protein
VRFKFEYPLSFVWLRIRLAWAAFGVGVVVALGTSAFVSSVGSAVWRTAACVRISGKVARYCGSATGRLSVFPGVVFRNGFCARKSVGGVELLQVRIGMRSLDGSCTNGGLALFSLGISGRSSRPTGGSVVAYYRSGRWVGGGVSFRGDARGGTFAAQGVAGSRGRAIGSYRC